MAIAIDTDGQVGTGTCIDMGIVIIIGIDII